MPTVQKQKNDKLPVSYEQGWLNDDAWGAAAGMRMLVWGQTGTGKTTLASTFPDPILWLVCSGGKRPGELKSIDTPENRKRIRPVILGSVGDLFNEVWGSLINPSPVRCYSDINKYKCHYSSVVLDHASGLQDMAFREILGLEELPVQKGWGMATQQQYGQLAAQVKDAMLKLLNLSANVVILAQERVFGEDSNSDIIRPTVGAALTPSIASWLYPSCDYVVQTFLQPKKVRSVMNVAGKEVVTERRDKGVDYCLRVGPHDVYQTKFRLPRGITLPEYIVDPSYQGLQNLIAGKLPATV